MKLQNAQQQQEWDLLQPHSERQYGDLRGVYVPDIPDGEEHQHWADGSEYYGEWRDGQPNGRGIYVSKSGQDHECFVGLLHEGVHYSICFSLSIVCTGFVSL